jgi:Tfp pilus assembly protein PilE
MHPQRVAMTLIEMLVAVALGMAIIAMAWTAFVRANASAARATARVDLHATAAVVREYLNRDVANMAPAIAFFARSTPQVAGTADDGSPIRTDTVELVFMRTVARLGSEMSAGSSRQAKSDFAWVRWRFQRVWSEVGGIWTPGEGRLFRSSSTPVREWTTLSAYAPPAPLIDPVVGKPAWPDYGGARWLNLPRPLRDASEGIASLDFNRYGVPASAVDQRNSDMTDIGDLADLDRTGNDRLVSARVRDFAVGWVDARGRQFTVTSSTAADHRLDGLYMDVVGPANNPYQEQIAGRPRVVRATCSMADAATGVSQDFAFSVAAPGLHPQIGR